MTAGMLEIHLANSSHRLNETMRVLTVIATISESADKRPNAIRIPIRKEKGRVSMRKEDMV